MKKEKVIVLGLMISVALLLTIGCDSGGSSGGTGSIYNDTYNLDLRDTGPAGGLIFYVNPYADRDGWKYLEAAPASTQWTDTEWGKQGTVVGTGTGIGTGKLNTELIIAVLNTAPAQSGRAAQLCDALSEGGYDDWFFPSKDEVYQMYRNLVCYDVGGFYDNFYWTSSERDADSAYQRYLENGSGASQGNLKDGNWCVRAVRAF